MPSSTLRRAMHEPRRVAAIAAGALAGPLVWLTLLEVNYVMTYVACEQRHDWMLHVASAVALALVGLAGLGAWRARTSGPTEAPTANQDETSELRARVLAYRGAPVGAGVLIV